MVSGKQKFGEISRVYLKMSVEQNQLPVTYLKPAKGLAALNLRDLWDYRELIYFLTWRDLKVRYKQTLLGFSWVILQPVINMVVFTILFGELLSVPTGGIPYPIFSFAALLPWTYFAGSLSRSSTTLVGSANFVPPGGPESWRRRSRCARR